MDLVASRHGGTVDVTWLMRALEHARSQEQERVVDYLEAIADDVVFETESAARNGTARWTSAAGGFTFSQPPNSSVISGIRKGSR